MGNPISNTSFLEPTVCFILFRSVVHLHSFRLKKSSIKRVFEFPYKFSYAQTREFYWQTYFKRWQIIAIFQIPAHACHFFDLVFSSPCNLLLLSPRGVEAARLLHYHNHIWKKKREMQLNRYPRITTSTMIIFYVFSFNHHRATFYSTTLAPVWSSANRVWFCREWRAARRDATHVTLATPKAKDPAHLFTCTLHVSLAFSIATYSSSSIYLVTQ